MMKEKREKIPKRLRGFGAVVQLRNGLRRQWESSIPEFHWWRNKIVELLWFLGLVVLNFYLAYPFFDTKFKYNFSAPLIPFLGRLFSFFSPLSLEDAIPTVVLLFYVLSPLTLYFLVKEVTDRLLPAVFAALLFSSSIFKSDRLSPLFHGDGGHVAALTLVPLVSYLGLRFLKSGSFFLCVLTSLGISLVALASPFGLFVLLVFLMIISFSEMLLGEGRAKLKRVSASLFLAAGFSAFWYNPDFARLVLLGGQGRDLLTTLINLLPLSFFIVPILGTFGFLLFERKPFLQPLFIASGLTIVFALISFAGRLGSRFFISFPDRYLPELSFSLCFLLGVIVTFIFDFLREKAKVGRFEIKPRFRGWAAVGFLLLIFLPLFVFILQGRTSPGALAKLEETGLGAPTNSEIGGIGEIRGQTGELAKMFGYFITSLTLGAVGYLGIRREGIGSRGG